MAAEMIRVIVHQEIGEGQVEAFRKMAEEMTAAVALHEPHTLCYEWFISDDGRQFCHVDTFRDSEAILEHYARAKEVAYKIPDMGRIIETLILGSPTTEAKELLSWLEPQFFPFLVGCTR